MIVERTYVRIVEGRSLTFSRTYGEGTWGSGQYGDVTVVRKIGYSRTVAVPIDLPADTGPIPVGARRYGDLAYGDRYFGGEA